MEFVAEEDARNRFGVPLASPFPLLLRGAWNEVNKAPEGYLLPREVTCLLYTSDAADE